MRFAWILLASLLPASSLAADDQFNCPKPAGTITVDDDIWKAWPSHTDKWLPVPLDVDFVCAINSDGRFVDCSFAAREQLTDIQIARLKDIMSRMMGYMKSDTPIQPCVASKIRLDLPPTEAN